MHVHTWVCSHSSSPTHAAVVLIKQVSPPHMYSHMLLERKHYLSRHLPPTLLLPFLTCSMPLERWRMMALCVLNQARRCGSLTPSSMDHSPAHNNQCTHTYNNEYWSSAVWPMHIRVVCNYMLMCTSLRLYTISDITL